MCLALTQRPEARGVAWRLRLGHGQIALRGARALARLLQLRRSDVGEAGREASAAAPRCGVLRCLELHDNELGVGDGFEPRAMQALACGLGATAGCRLRTLNLASNDLANEGVLALGAALMRSHCVRPGHVSPSP